MLMKKKRYLVSCLIIVYILTMVLCGSVLAAKPGKAQGNGTVEPFKLSLQALKGQETTDLYLNVTNALFCCVFKIIVKIQQKIIRYNS
jgi:hypothetical protein